MEHAFRRRAHRLAVPLRLIAILWAAAALWVASGSGVLAAQPTPAPHASAPHASAPHASAQPTSAPHASAPAAPTFSDVPASFWGYTAITRLALQGIVAGMPSGRFRPDAPVTRAQFTKMLVLAMHVPLPSAGGTPAFADVPRTNWAFPYVQAASSAGIVGGVGGGRFAPDLPVSRQAMAVMLGRSLGLEPAATAAGAPDFADAASIAPWARGFVTVMADLGLVDGLPGRLFDPLAPTSRAQAAVATARALVLPQGRITGALVPVARRIVLSAPADSIAPRASEPLTVHVESAQGATLPIQPTITASAGVLGPGDVFTAGAARGPVTIDARLGNLFASLRLTVRVAPASLAFVEPPSSLVAGEPANLSVALQASGGAVAMHDSGRTITLKITGPGGAVSRQQATDAGGFAHFTLDEQTAGTYKLAATADGLAATPDQSLSVNPGAPVALRLRATPSYLLLARGASAELVAEAVDSYGNVTPARFPVTVTSTGSGGSLQVLTRLATPGQPVARFTDDGHSGTTIVTLQAPGSQLETAQYTLVSQPNPTAAIAGKGMWLRYADLKRLGAAAIVHQAVADGISHLYLEVGSTYNGDGFWGAHQLDEILPVAHRAHIAVIAWIYDTLDNRAADLALVRRAATYATPGGQRADGLALDLETDSNMTPAIVGPFDQAVRGIVGPNYPLIAVTYPPQMRPNYPFATLSQVMNAIAPMDYWNVHPRDYSPAEVSAFVTASIDGLRRAAGQPQLPVAIIAEAYDMFSGSGSGLYSPSGAEISAAISTARSLGAVGVSLYEWGTATPAEWQALVSAPWN